MRWLDSGGEGFSEQLRLLTEWSGSSDRALTELVDTVFEEVISRGDQALLEFTQRFDGLSVATAAELELPKERMRAALEGLAAAPREALSTAAGRIRDYHQRQVQESWYYEDTEGTLLGQQITALDRVGVYVPGGKASYPSTVLMNVIPARVAGVREVVMAAPAPTGTINSMVLAAAAVAGVDRLFTIGGAQAIAALAYGTETIPAVDKIVGPGNLYVAAAKRRAYGRVGIDMVAGPSEILIICDGNSDPDWIAMDLIAQAEHDENALAMLLSPDGDFLRQVKAGITRLLPDMERRQIIRASLDGRGALIKTRDIADAVAIANLVAPEHLELALDEPRQWLPHVRHAGAIFLGRNTPEAFGDYCAGPNHVLPTAGTARFSSPLGVYDFVKRSSVIMASEAGVRLMTPLVSQLARAESLPAHARAAECRLPAKDSDAAG